MECIEKIGRRAKESTYILSSMGTKEKNRVLKEVSKVISDNKENIIKANKIDIENAIKNNMKTSLIDRLKLTNERIEEMAKGLLKITSLQDPIGEIVSGKVLENGLEICEKRVPLGVIAIIYEARPNVTVDAFGLCFKAGNSIILRGGTEAINSNKKIVECIKQKLKDLEISEDIINLIEDTSRKTVLKLMKLNKYVDVLIPRGGAGLIKTVVENSTIPVIETGTGNCHIYVDKFANFSMALNIIENAKTQRTGVCNSCEALVIHKDISEEFIPSLVERLSKKVVELRGDNISRKICKEIKVATEEDWGMEYLDLIVSIKIVNNMEEAINHINKYSTHHSEAIITDNYEVSRTFLNKVDSSAVYVNASTRFTDGAEFGLGAEIRNKYTKITCKRTSRTKRIDNN